MQQESNGAGGNLRGTGRKSAASGLGGHPGRALAILPYRLTDGLSAGGFRYWQMIWPSIPDVAPAPTCTEQFVKPTEIDGLVTPTVYPLELVVMVIVLPLDIDMLLALCS